MQLDLAVALANLGLFFKIITVNDSFGFLICYILFELCIRNVRVTTEMVKIIIIITII